MEFLRWLQALPLSSWVTFSDFGFPILLAFHSVGLSAVVGVLVLLDLRVLGIAKAISLKAFEQLMWVAWVGLLINVCSGAVLFMANGPRLVSNWPFLVKMACVILGGVTGGALWRQLRAGGSVTLGEGGDGQLVQDYNITPASKMIAIVSIGMWFGAILFGRLIAYVMDHALLEAGGGR